MNHLFSTYKFSRRSLLMVAFVDAVSLRRAAEILRELGAYQAMNLDGGASVALASRGNIVYPAGRSLTNVIAIYDARNPAPSALKTAWTQFQQGQLRPQVP